MKEEKLLIDKKELFVQLFRIYEEEFSTILQYVAPIKENYKTTSNKIHELHLRICAELENLVKEIAKQVKPDFDFNADYQMKKKTIEKIEEIIKKLSTEEQEIIKKSILWKHPDFSYFLSLLDKEIALCSKKIKFLSDLETIPINTVGWFDKGFYIQPFDRFEKEWEWGGDGNIPKRWTNYNNVKHDKIKNYRECSLWDLILSFWAYYIALNYLVFWYDSKILIQSIPYNDPTKWNLEYWVHPYDIWNNIFEITVCVTESGHFMYDKQELNDQDYENYKPIIDDLNKKLKLYYNSPLKIQECLYCVYQDYQGIIYASNLIDVSTHEHRRTKKHFIKFVNKIE